MSFAAYVKREIMMNEIDDDRLSERELGEFLFSGKNKERVRDFTSNKKHGDSLIAGAFLACGTITNPTKDYHLEFVVHDVKLAQELMNILRRCGFKPKSVKRNNVDVVYFKDSESIEDLLVVMGASNSSLEIMGAKILKDVRNNVNRKVNFETANFEKTVYAATEQIIAIRKIEKEKGLIFLPEELRNLAKLRLENPDYSLRQLGEESEPKISRSGVNHRLSKIMKIAEEL